MAKTFRVDSGFDVLVERVWYGHHVLLLIEPGQKVEVHRADGLRRACVGSYRYEELEEDKPPVGLRKR